MQSVQQSALRATNTPGGCAPFEVSPSSVPQQIHLMKAAFAASAAVQHGRRTRACRGLCLARAAGTQVLTPADRLMAARAIKRRRADKE
eukprot:CAMPEP_0183335688 /NCGR_PEP_ID=MMETSP0164_2-20130417/3912_1 /TAXON_ID=221442 /ORGANISM="Coccolithus pelagicus ssp braarudi, Strain PLY182g" /LENGTH=88 /DNA_ID=CAMNT_0025505093 /DNA_START=441 /DNA_END=704 /DNA_ORIENTATION=+